jgi:hypothetical protein
MTRNKMGQQIAIPLKVTDRLCAFIFLKKNRCPLQRNDNNLGVGVGRGGHAMDRPLAYGLWQALSRILLLLGTCRCAVCHSKLGLDRY